MKLRSREREREKKKKNIILNTNFGVEFRKFKMIPDSFVLSKQMFSGNKATDDAWLNGTFVHQENQIYREWISQKRLLVWLTLIFDEMKKKWKFLP